VIEVVQNQDLKASPERNQQKNQAKDTMIVVQKQTSIEKMKKR